MSENTPRFVIAQDYEPVMQQAIPLIGMRGDQWFMSGTAVIIGQDLALTARHVVEDYLRRYEGDVWNSSQRDLEASFVLLGIQARDKGKQYAAYSVYKIYAHTALTDIVFLRFRVPDKETRYWQTLKLSPLPPNVGDLLRGFGYHSSDVEIAGSQIYLKNSPTTTSGQVIEVHDRYRDKGMLDFPCYEANMRIDGGMSGGPVFNVEGKLCGIMVSNLPPDDDGLHHVSYVASLWPIFGIQVDINREGFKRGLQYPALELAEYGHLVVEDWEKISLDRDNDGNTTRVSVIHE